MRNRLELAKKILSSNGTIAISIDHNEVSYLILLLDEIFGKENRKNIVTVKRGSVTGAKVINPGVVNVSEYVLIYSRNRNLWNPNRIYTSKEWDRRYNNYIINYNAGFEKWKFTTVLEAFASEVKIPKSKLKNYFKDDYDKKLEEFFYLNSEKIIQFATLDDNSISQSAIEIKNQSEKNPNKVYLMERVDAKPYYIFNGKLILFAKDRLSNVDGIMTFSQPATDIWDDVLPNDLHNEGGVALRKGKKQEKLIDRILDLCSSKNDIVLDFFSGSGTTGSVCLKKNRQFIIVEQLEYTETLPLKRLVNTIDGEQSGISKAVNWQGGGSFIYMELAKNNQKAIDYIQNCQSYDELVAFFDKMCDTYFLDYNLKINEFREEVSKEENFKQLSLNKQKEIFTKMLDLNQLYVNVSDMEDSKFKMNENDIRLTNDFYKK